MAPNKFEKHIKDQLEKRSLQPTDKAWDKLSQRLEQDEKTQNKKPFFWMGLAASVVGILIVVSQFVSYEDVQNKTPKVVASPQIIFTDTVAENENDISIESITPQIKSNLLKSQTSEKSSGVAEADVVNEINSSNKASVSKSLDLQQEPLQLKSQKIKNIVAQVQMLETNTRVTDADIEALLQQAKADLNHNKWLNKSEGIVDANTLLQDVEEDLERSFRSKVFEAIKASYKSVKTAVAQRND